MAGKLGRDNVPFMGADGRRRFYCNRGLPPTRSRVEPGIVSESTPGLKSLPRSACPTCAEGNADILAGRKFICESCRMQAAADRAAVLEDAGIDLGWGGVASPDIWRRSPDGAPCRGGNMRVTGLTQEMRQTLYGDRDDNE